MSHPPKPRLTLRIGVTGHRPNKLAPGAVETLRGRVRHLLEQIAVTLDAIWKANADCFSSDKPRLIVVSALAAGSDQVVAEVARDLNLELHSPLPFERAEYLRDFNDPSERRTFERLLTEASVFELAGMRAEEDRAYERVGLFVLRQSDLVIAVWDGDVGSGRGGTFDLVQAATAAGIPLLHYDEHGAGPSILLPPEGGAAIDARDLIRDATPVTDASVEAVVRRLTEPPSPEQDTSARHRLIDYYGEKERLTNNWLAYPLLLRVVAGRKGVRKSRRPAPYIATTKATWTHEYWAPIEGACSVDARLDNKSLAPANLAEELQPRFAWADGLAIYYGQSYRSSYVLAFVLGALAVFFAVLPLPVNLLLEWWFGAAQAKSLHLYVELGASALALTTIVGVSLLVWQGRQQRRHEKWLDYRLLAERLRVLRVLALTGSPVRELRVPHQNEGPRSQQSWVTWYIRATSREIGMPRGQGSPQYAEMVKCALLAAELRGQARFHESYAARELTIAARFEWLGARLFAASAIVTAVAILFFGYMIASEMKTAAKVVADLTMFVVAAFPAMGAALFALRSHGEFERNAKLSEATRKRLESIIDRLDKGGLDFSAVARATDETAEVLTGELADWQFVFWGKPLTLPG